MNIQDLLCKEFCGALTVSQVPAGFAVGTGYDGPSGDPIGFFVVGPNTNGKFQIEDDGLSIPILESMGVDITSKTRSEAFLALLNEYNIIFDDNSGELSTDQLTEAEIAPAAMRFLAFLLRVQDFLLLTKERVASTFREDAMRILSIQLDGRATIMENHVIHEDLKEYPADIAIFAEERDPVALFFGLSDAHIYEALLLQSYAANKQIPCSVVALLETQQSGVSHKVQQRANNHLDAVPIFRGAEEDACARIAKEAGINLTLH